MLGNVKLALSLLDQRSRRLLVLLVIAQAFLSLLDMLGVVIVGLVAALGASAISGVEPEPLKTLADQLDLNGMNEIWLAVVLAVVAGLMFIGKSVASFLLVRRAYRFLAGRQAIVAGKLAAELLSRPLLDLQQRTSQQTSYALVGGVNALTLGVLGGAVIVASEASVLVVLTAGLLVVDWLVALFTLAFFGIVGTILYRILGSWAKQLGETISVKEIESITSVQNAVRTYREISVTGRRSLVIHDFQDLRWQASKVLAEVQVLGQVSKYVFEIALILGAGLLAVSQFLTRDLIAAIAVIAVFLAAASRIMPSLLRMQTAVLGIRGSSGQAAPTYSLASDLKTPLEDDWAPPELEDIEFETVDGVYSGFVPCVRVESVTLKYPSAEQPALKQVSLFVEAGESLALTGPTGAGKTTLADVILGVLEPDSGTVSLGGARPDQASHKWPGAIAYVPQETAVINGTIRQNVALGIPSMKIDDSLVWEALRRAHLSEYTRSEPKALDTIVGEHGVRLSGGQRQRLGLARALYTRPRLIVLDEATSALDAETESAVTTALKELTGSVTLVIVAHRLATIRYCTQVAYIEDGEIIALGDFDSVRKAQPNFDRQARLLGL